MEEDGGLRFLCLLFTSHLQHQNTILLVRTAERLLDAGHEVCVFMIGDGVYNAFGKIGGRGTSAAAEMLRLKGAEFICCSTCVSMRGGLELAEGVRQGTLEELAERMERADAVLNYTGEV
ncbi:MAG: DsrE family protein [Methanomassiliicoccales archaeon]